MDSGNKAWLENLLHNLHLMLVRLVLSVSEPNDEQGANDLNKAGMGHPLNNLIVHSCCELVIVSVVSHDVVDALFVLQLVLLVHLVHQRVLIWQHVLIWVKPCIVFIFKLEC